MKNKNYISRFNSFIFLASVFGKVIASYDERLALIKSQITAIAKKSNGNVIIESRLINEVTSLVEWPISFIGNFDSGFLKLPKEVLIAVMQDNQKYFPIVDHKRKLMPLFICVANIESNKPELIKEGKFINAVSGLTIFIEKREKDGSFKNIFIDDSSKGINKITYSKNGKIVELAVKNIIDGNEIKNKEALANPEVLEQYKNLKELNY